MPALIVMYSNGAPTPGHVLRLQGIGNGLRLVVCDSETAALESAGDAQVILGHRYLRQVMPHAGAVRWVHSTAAGFDHLLTPAFLARAPILTRTPIFSDTIAWHALALALASLRRLPDYIVPPDRSGGPPPGVEPLNVPRTALILGMGEIGTRLGRLLKGLGVRVRGADTVEESADGSSCDERLDRRAWRAALEDTDLFFICLPMAADTIGIVNADVLRRLPSHAILVSVARPGVIDLHALLEQLEAGRLAAAGLDVRGGIDDDLQARLAASPGVLLTPKVSSFSLDRQSRLEAFVEDQVRRYVTGEPLLYQVSYRHGTPQTPGSGGV